MAKGIKKSLRSNKKFISVAPTFEFLLQSFVGSNGLLNLSTTDPDIARVRRGPVGCDCSLLFSRTVAEAAAHPDHFEKPYGFWVRSQFPLGRVSSKRVQTAEPNQVLYFQYNQQTLRHLARRAQARPVNVNLPRHGLPAG
jgi:hypothetical protein